MSALHMVTGWLLGTGAGLAIVSGVRLLKARSSK